MDRRRIGALDVSVAGLGCNNFASRLDADEARRVVDAALEAGIDHFDTAESYSDGRSEELLGQALAGRRHEVTIATKFGERRTGALAPGSRRYVQAAVEASLARLGTDHVDLYYLHRPDPDTPIAETLAALGELVAKGVVREIGCSDLTPAQLREAAGAAANLGGADLGGAGFACLQSEYSLLERDVEAEVLPTCRALQMAFVPYFPLAAGVLTGKYRAGEAPPPGTRLARWGERGAALLGRDRLALVDRYEAYARAHGHSLPELALSYLAGCPQVSCVITGAMSPEQVRANVAATVAWAMTDAERAEVAGLS